MHMRIGREMKTFGVDRTMRRGTQCQFHLNGRPNHLNGHVYAGTPDVLSSAGVSEAAA